MTKASLALPIHLGYKEGVPMLAAVQFSANFQLPLSSYTQSFYEVKKVFLLSTQHLDLCNTNQAMVSGYEASIRLP